MKKTVIISGNNTDIDVLACAIAYKNVLSLLGKESFTAISKDFGGTIPKSILNWGFMLDDVPVQDQDNFIVVDLSIPEYIDIRANQENIVELRDHHPGYERYRQEKLSNKATIEHIGACATLIYEQAEKNGIVEKLEKYSINLLLTAILSNTLNFKAQITHKRDMLGYERLISLSDLPTNWVEIYFTEVEKDIIQNAKESLLHDTKVMQILGTHITISQIELWESYEFMMKHKYLIEEILESYGYVDWLFTSPSISEGVNHLFTRSSLVKEVLAEKIGANFTGDFGTTNQLRLRKEIRKALG